jgi:hypothetical protein
MFKIISWAWIGIIGTFRWGGLIAFLLTAYFAGDARKKGADILNYNVQLCAALTAVGVAGYLILRRSFQQWLNRKLERERPHNTA